MSTLHDTLFIRATAEEEAAQEIDSALEKIRQHIASEDFLQCNGQNLTPCDHCARVYGDRNYIAKTIIVLNKADISIDEVETPWEAS